jgi:RNA polymerase sigma-70 factor (ECF subfamily)
MPTKLIDSTDKEEAVVASIESHPVNADMALVAAAKNGDKKAFEILVERHEQRIFFVAQRMTRNREDAEDVVQQSFQKAFTHMDRFENRSSFATWLTQVAINEALMLLRKRRGLREVLIDDLNGNEEAAISLEFPDSSPDPEASYAQREWVGMLSLAMNELTPGIRKAIQLRELDERSSEETARIMGISVSALKGRMFHGRKRLRETIKRYIDSARMLQKRSSKIRGNANDISRHRVACYPYG